MYLEGAETKRLKIRALTKSDIDDWMRFFENNPNLKYLGLDNNPDSKYQAEQWIQMQLSRYEENRYGHHALIDKHNGRFIGQCGLLSQEVEGKTEIEVGYHILPEFWGLGFATEASSKFIDYAFENKLSESIISIIDVRNKASQKVAVKNGMTMEKQIEMYGLKVLIYRIINKLQSN